MERVAVLLLVALVASTQAGPLQVSVGSCSKECTGANKFNYQPGLSYEYAYKADVKTMMQGANSEVAGVIMTASVHLDVLSKCEMSMRLSEVKLEEHDPEQGPARDISRGFTGPLEKNPVLLSFQDGNVEHMCLTGEEPTWVLNVKRGVVSLLQNNMDKFSVNKTVSEIDVSGNCKTDYGVSGSGWYTMTITKTKDLLGCKDRQGYSSSVQGIPYSSESYIQSLPIVKSQLDCSHTITQNNILKTVNCHEQHVFRPFSKSDSGATTVNTQELRFLKESRGIRALPAISRDFVSLKFDHKTDGESQSDTKNDLKQKLQEICLRTESGVTPETPKLFTDLVFIVKSAYIKSLNVAYTMVEGDKFCPNNPIRTRKFLLDALPMAGTGPAVKMMTNLAMKKTVTGSEVDMWITSLAFIKNPTVDMLQDVKPLLNMKGHEEKTYLSIGTLIHNYCHYTGGCEKDFVVKALVSAIENKMAKNCKVTPETQQSTVMVLRGLGNAGHIVGSIPTLEACMKSDITEIRLSAIDAFRRMPCDANRKSLVSLFTDQDEDSEIRIAAYRALMQCPTEQVLSTVKSTLEREQANQVGSYVWTHLTNLMETSDRHKQDIRSILEDETFKKVFDLDKRKFSRNYEGSFFLDALNTGAKVEGDLIWSQKSFIPRSSMVNLTVDLFGHSINMFELGGRVEGLEYLLETFFGPNGYFSQKAAASAQNTLPQSVHPQKMKRINSKFGANMDDFRGSLYMRMFGNELNYYSFDSMEDLLSSDINVLDMLVQLAKDNDYTYSQSSMFLDSSIIIPTGAGFPLNLTVNGTSTMDLRMKGKMDLRSPPNVIIDGLVQPSAAIGISSLMSVDAFVACPGIKMVSSLHSSTSIKGKLIAREDGTVTAEYEMPEPKQEIIDVKTSFFTIHANTEREQSMISANSKTSKLCTPQKVTTVTGLELCAEVSYPNDPKAINAPYFPFTGPMSAGVYLYKKDMHAKYTMNIKSVHNNAMNMMHFSFDTPGSQTERTILADITLNKDKQTVDAVLKTPWTTGEMQGSTVWEKKNMGFTGKVSANNKQVITIDAKMVKDRVGNAHRYTPSAEITVLNKKPVSVSGQFMYNGYRQIDLQGSLEGIRYHPISASVKINNRPALFGIKASMELEKDKPYSFDTSLSTQETKKKIVFSPTVSVRSPATEVLAFGGSVEYAFNKKVDVNLVLDKILTKKVTLKGFVAVLPKKKGRKIFRTIMKYTSAPMDLQINAKIDNRNYRVIANDIDFTYVIRGVARNNIKLVSKIQNQSSKQLSKGKTTLNLNVKRNPEYNVRLVSNVNHNKKLTDMDLDLRYGANFKDESKRIDMAFEMNRNLKSIMQASADIMMRFSYPGMGLSMIMKGDHKHSSNELDTNVEMRLGKRPPIQSSLKMWEHWETQKKVSGEYILSYPGRTITLNHTLAAINGNKYVSTLNAQLQKGQKSSITTTLDTTDKKPVHVTSDIVLNGFTPMYIEGKFMPDPSNFLADLSMEKESKRYSSSLKSSTVDYKSSSMTLDLEHPYRRVILNMEGKVVRDVVHAKGDLRWDAIKDDSKRITVSGWIEPPMPDKVNGSLTISYPSRTLKMNAYHIQGIKYATYADFQWEADKKISVNTIVSMKEGLLANAKINTPFKQFSSLVMKLNHNDNKEEYNTNLDLNLNEKKSFIAETTLKKPISLRTFVGSLTSRNNFAEIKKVKLDIDHKLSNSLASSGKLSWNKQSIQAQIILQNTTSMKKTGFKGTFDLKTTMKFMKKVKLEVFHSNNGKLFNTDAKFQRNRKVYSVISEIRHLPFTTRYENKGVVEIKIPTGMYDTTWTHRYTSDSILTTYKTEWGKNKQSSIDMKLDANFGDMFDTRLNIKTPFSNIQNLDLETSLMKKENLANAKFDLSMNDNVLGSTEIGYTMVDGNANAGAALSIPKLDVDSSIKASFLGKDNSASFSGILTPKMTASLDISSGLVLWKSTFPGYEQIRYTYEITDETQLITKETLEYGNGKIITLSTMRQYDQSEKRVSIELTTPFKTMSKFSAGINFLGSLETFNSDASIEIQPVFNKITLATQYDSKSHISGNIRLDTPFETYEYFEAEFTSNQKADKDTINMRIEYLPRQVVNFEWSHEKQSETKMTLTSKLSVPSGSLMISHKMNRANIESSAELDISGSTYSLGLDINNIQKTMATVTLNTPSRRPIVLIISHEGEAKDFSIHTEVQHNRKNNMVSDFTFSYKNKVTVDLRSSLKTELISDEQYTAAINYHGSLAQFDSRAEITTTSLGKSSVEIDFSTHREISGKIGILSPHIQNIRSSFSHFYSTGFMQSKAELIHGGNKLLNIDTSLKIESSIIAEVTVQNPWTEDLQGLIRVDGKLTNFALRTGGSIGNRKAELEYISRVEPESLEQTISFKATNMKDVKAELSLKKQSDYSGFAELTYGFDTHRIDVTYANLRFIDGTLSVTSPLFKTVSANFNIKGNLRNFFSTASFNFGSDKTEVKMNLKASQPLKGGLSITSPYIKDVAVTFEHNMENGELDSIAKLTMDKDEFNAKLILSTNKQMMASFELTTPFRGWERIQASFKHQGNTENFNVNAEYTLGPHKSDANLNFINAVGKCEGHLNIHSHLIPDISAGFDYRNIVHSFMSSVQSHAELTVGQHKSEAGHSYQVQHGILTEFKSNAIVGEKFNGGVYYSFPDNMTRKLEVTMTDKIDISLEHVTYRNGFEIKSMYKIGQEESNVQFIFNSVQGYPEISLKVTSSSIEDIEFELNIQPPKTNYFSSHMGWTYAGEKSAADFEMRASGDVRKYELTVVSPFTETTNIKFSHQGPLDSFTTKADISIGNEVSTGEVVFQKTTSSLVTKITMKSPEHDLKLDFKQNGQPKKFTTTGEFSLNKDVFELNLDVDLLTKTGVKVSMSTPDISFRTSHSGSIKRFESQIEIVKDTDTYSVNTEWNIEEVKNMEVSLSLSSPIKSYESFIMNFKHTLEQGNSHCQLKLITPQQTSVYINNLKIDENGATLDMSYPDLNIKVFHDISPKKKEAYVSFELNKEITKISLNLEQQRRIIKGSFELISPMDSLKLAKLEGMLSLDNDYLKIYRANSAIDFTFNEDKHTLKASYALRPTYKASLSMASVYFPSLDLNFNLGGKLTNFEASSEVLIDGEKQGMIEVNSDIVDQQTVSVNIMTPIENFKTMQANIVFKVDSPVNIDTSSKLIIEGATIYSAGIKFTDTMDSVTGSAQFDSAYLHPTSTSFSFIQQGRLYKSSAEITHASDSLLAINGQFNYPDSSFNTDGSLTIKPGFLEYIIELDEKFKPIQLSFNVENGQENVKSHIETTVQGLKWEADVEGAFNKLNKDASFEIRIPERDTIKGAATYKQKFSKYIASASFELDSLTKYDYTMNLKTRNGLDGKMTLTTPLESLKVTKVSVSHDGSFPNIKSEAKIECDSKTVSASIELTHTSEKVTGLLTVLTPIEGYKNIEASFNQMGSSWSNFKADGSVSYTTGEAIVANVEHTMQGANVRTMVSIMSPFTNKIELNVDHAGPIDDFTCVYELKNGNDNSIKLSNNFKISHEHINLMATLNTVMAGKSYQQMIQLKHDGGIKDFKTAGNIKIDSYVMGVDVSFKLEPVIEGSLSLINPYRPVKLSFSHSGTSKAFLTTGELQYDARKSISGKVDLLMHNWNRMELTTEVKTPFQNYEESKITYQHSGSLESFKCDMSALFARKEISSILTGRTSSPSFSLTINTPFVGFKRMDAKFNLGTDRRGRFSTRLEGSLNSEKLITAELKLSSIHGKIEANGMISSPYTVPSGASFDFSHQFAADNMMNMLKATLNGKNILDIETTLNLMTAHKHASIIMRAPSAMKYEIEGDFTLMCVEVDATANWNMKQPESSIKLTCGYDIREENTAHFKFVGLNNEIAYSGQFLRRHIKSDLSLNTNVLTAKYGIEATMNKNGAFAKLMLPSRSIEMTGTTRYQVTEGSLLWDADRDTSKKVHFRSVIIPSFDSVKADLTLSMPSMRKQYQIASEVIVNSGKKIFDGKVELSYSQDERQKIVLSTSLEDVSSVQGANYSFSLGMSHPYSTVGIKLASHVGKSSDKYSAGMDLEYLTARRQTKTFQINGMVNKLRKTAKFEIQSPVKSISIASSMETGDEFRVMLTNIYDRKQPISTLLTVSPRQRSVHFVTNYDLDNPKNTYEVRARYVNSSAVEAEAYHVMRQNKYSDVLLAARLNNSQLLHTRVHWRPEMFQELQAYRNRKMNEYRRETAVLLEEVESAMLIEFVEKSELMWDIMEKELGPEKMAKLSEMLYPVAEKVASLGLRLKHCMLNNFLNPLAGLASSSHTTALTYIPNEIPYMTPIKMSTVLGYPSDRAQEMTHAIKRIISVNNTSSEYEGFLLSLIEHEIELMFKDLVAIKHGVEMTVYDPTNGEIQTEVHLPIKMKSLESMPGLNLPILRTLRILTHVIPSSSTTEVIVPDSTGEWMPPFSGVATISKGHRITTFDGYVYDLPIDCTLILARDYTDGNFSLIMTNNEDTTLTLVGGSKPVQISIDGKVSIGGRVLTELPYVSKDISITRQGNIVHITLEKIIDIKYDTSIDHITVKMNGWYFGKTGGLLGTYDNEPSNDLMTSFGKVNTNEARFAKTWDVGKIACQK